MSNGDNPEGELADPIEKERFRPLPLCASAGVVIVLLVCVSSFSIRYARVEDAIILISALGGSVSSDDVPIIGPTRIHFGSPLPGSPWREVTDEHLVAALPLLSHLTRVGTVSFRDCPGVTRASITQILRVFELRELFVAGTSISNEALVDISKEKSIERLDLSETDVTAEGLQVLGEMPRLRELWLSDSMLSESESRQVRQWLPNVRIVMSKIPR